MTLKFFLQSQDFECLKRAVPRTARCFSALEQSVHFTNVAGPGGTGTSVLTCDDMEARDLMAHARDHCPKAATRIAEAFRAAGLTP
jgi:hypothetical protein